MAHIIRGDDLTPPRPGKWMVKFKDAGRWRRLTYPNRRAAQDALAEKIRTERTHPQAPRVDSRITLTKYAEVHWLPAVQMTRKVRTWHLYSDAFAHHIRPVLGAREVREIDRSEVRTLLVRLALAPKSVKFILAVIRGLLSAAVEDGIMAANPVLGLGRSLGLSKAASPTLVKALTAEQLNVLLDALRTARHGTTERRLYPFFLTIAHTGIRLGEALGLRWEDVDLPGRCLQIRQQISRGVVGSPKSGRERVVSISLHLAAVLREHERTIKTETLRRGWGAVPELVFVSAEGTMLDESRVRKALRRTVIRAGLPRHFTPHSLRHTFASLHLSRGESPQWVQEQLGHASLTMTTQVYGRWLPKQPVQGGAEGFAEALGHKMVTAPAQAARVGLQVRDTYRGVSPAPFVSLLTLA